MLQHGPDCPWLALSEQQVGEMNEEKVQPMIRGSGWLKTWQFSTFHCQVLAV